MAIVAVTMLNQWESKDATRPSATISRRMAQDWGFSKWTVPARGKVASVGIAAVFATFYGLSLHEQHSLYDTSTFDLGLIAQVAWNSLHGRWFSTSIMPFNYLAEHLSPVLVPVSLLFLLWRDAEVLLILQAVAAAAAGTTIYVATSRKTGSQIAGLLLQLAYGLAPATAWVIRDDFHPISLAMPLVGLATALLWFERYGLAALAATLMLLTNEEAALWVAPFGLLLILVGRRRALLPGASVTVLAIAWLMTYLFIIVPVVRPASLAASLPHPDVRAFSQCGNNVSEVLGCLVLNPVATFQRATTEGDRDALIALFAPTAGLGVLGPSFLVALLRWLVVLLGNDPPGYKLHYVAVLTPAAYLAAGEAIAFLRQRARMPAAWLAVLVICSSLVAYLLVSPLPGGGAYDPYLRHTAQRAAIIARAVGMVPSEAEINVAATSGILPHLALRERITLIFDDPSSPPDYRIYDLRDPYPITREELARYVALLRVEPRYKVIFEEDDVLVFKREQESPERASDADFGGVVRLVGYTITPLEGKVRIRLYWLTAGPQKAEYHFFVHLVDDLGKGFSQKDGELASGYLRSHSWPAGAPLREEIVLEAPALSEWHRYSLEIGWYNIDTGERLKLPDGRDHLVMPLAPTNKE